MESFCEGGVGENRQPPFFVGGLSVAIVPRIPEITLVVIIWDATCRNWLGLMTRPGALKAIFPRGNETFVCLETTW